MATKDQNENYALLWEAAVKLGMDAGRGNNPEPMTVTDGNQDWFVADGVCGFAWITLAGNTPFGRWAKKSGVARKAYGGGLHIWCWEFNQSMQRKEAYCRAASKHLKENGIIADCGSRMD